MMDKIVVSLKFCSVFLMISLINWMRYFLLKRKIELIYKKDEEQICKAIRCNKIKFPAFLSEPLEAGDSTLDLLLFKIHRSVVYFIGLLFFYGIAVIFAYLAFRR